MGCSLAWLAALLEFGTNRAKQNKIPRWIEIFFFMPPPFKKTFYLDY